MAGSGGLALCLRARERSWEVVIGTVMRATWEAGSGAARGRCVGWKMVERSGGKCFDVKLLENRRPRSLTVSSFVRVSNRQKGNWKSRLKCMRGKAITIRTVKGQRADEFLCILKQETLVLVRNEQCWNSGKKCEGSETEADMYHVMGAF